jgi:phage tail-like protein
MSNFYFSLSFKGEHIPFEEVSGIAKEMQIEEPSSDVVNRFKYKLPDFTKVENLTLKRGVAPKDAELLTWCQKTTQGFSIPVETNNIVVHLLNESGESIMEWTFHKAFPVKYVLSDFRSQNNEVVIVSVEFIYTYFDISKTKQ